MKFGVAFLRNGLWGDNRPALGTWTFSVDQPFDPTKLSSFVPVAASVRQFSATLLPLPVFTPHDLLSEYVQDEWKPTAGLTLNVGLRYDYEFHAFNQGISASSKDFQGNPVLPFAGTSLDIAATGVDFSKRGDRTDFGPRAGVAWDLRKNGSTVVRADYGIYFNPTNLGLESSELANFKQLSVTVANPPYPDPYGGRDPKTFVSTAPQNIQVMANNLKMQRSIAYSEGSRRVCHRISRSMLTGSTTRWTAIRWRSISTHGRGVLERDVELRGDRSAVSAAVRPRVSEPVHRLGELQGHVRAAREAFRQALHVLDLLHARGVEGPHQQLEHVGDDRELGRSRPGRRPEQQRPPPRAGGERLGGGPVERDAGDRLHVQIGDAVQRGCGH